LQAAFLRAKLPLLDRDNARRAEIAEIYQSGLYGATGLKLPTISPTSKSVWHLYTVEHAQRDELARKLAHCGIDTMIHYPIPPHLQPAYSWLGKKKGDFPVAEKIHSEILSLPMGPCMSTEVAEEVVVRVREFC